MKHPPGRPTHQCIEVPVYPGSLVHIRQLFGLIDAIHSHFVALLQAVSIATDFKDQLIQARPAVRGLTSLVLGPQVEVGLVQAVSDQGVVTVSLEVVLPLVKGRVVRVTPDLTVSWSYG